MDRNYAPIARRFFDSPADLEDAFAKAWFKLTHRDMGPRSRYLGPLVPSRAVVVARPYPRGRSSAERSEQDIADLKAKVLTSGLSVSQMVMTAWASAATFRGTDKRGGTNGARIRLEPQKGWEVNAPGTAGESPADIGAGPDGVQQRARPMGRE